MQNNFTPPLVDISHSRLPSYAPASSASYRTWVKHYSNTGAERFGRKVVVELGSDDS
jgi:hypothetical protein